MNELLRVEIQEKRFGDQLLYRDAIFVAMEGERIAITGESGSGKSTLLRIASGLDPYFQGDFRYHGVKQEKKKVFSAMRKKVSFVSQNIDLIDHLTVMENILLPFPSAGEARTKKKSPLC